MLSPRFPLLRRILTYPLRGTAGPTAASPGCPQFGQVWGRWTGLILTQGGEVGTAGACSWLLQSHPNGDDVLVPGQQPPATFATTTPGHKSLHVGKDGSRTAWGQDPDANLSPGATDGSPEPAAPWGRTHGLSPSWCCCSPAASPTWMAAPPAPRGGRMHPQGLSSSSAGPGAACMEQGGSSSPRGWDCSVGAGIQQGQRLPPEPRGVHGGAQSPSAAPVPPHLAMTQMNFRDIPCPVPPSSRGFARAAASLTPGWGRDSE